MSTMLKLSRNLVFDLTVLVDSGIYWQLVMSYEQICSYMNVACIVSKISKLLKLTVFTLCYGGAKAMHKMEYAANSYTAGFSIE